MENLEEEFTEEFDEEILDINPAISKMYPDSLEEWLFNLSDSELERYNSLTNKNASNNISDSELAEVSEIVLGLYVNESKKISITVKELRKSVSIFFTSVVLFFLWKRDLISRTGEFRLTGDCSFKLTELGKQYMEELN